MGYEGIRSDGLVPLDVGCKDQGYSGAKRLEAIPDLPTIGEAGLPGFQFDTGWHAWFAPARTPDRIITKIYSAIHKSLQLPKLRYYFLVAGYQPTADPPSQFQKSVQADIKRWGELVRLAKITPE